MNSPDPTSRFQRKRIAGYVLAVPVLLLGLVSTALLASFGVSFTGIMPGQLLLTSAGIGLAVVFPIAVAQLSATTEFANTNRFAAIGTGLIAILAGYVLTCFAMKYGFMQTYANPEFYLFLNSIGCFLSGIVVFTFVHQFAPSWIGLTPICKSGELVKKRFSLLSSLVWTSCICALLGIFLKQDLFPSHLWAAFGIQLAISFGVSLCIHLAVTLPVTAWLDLKTERLRTKISPMTELTLERLVQGTTPLPCMKSNCILVPVVRSPPFICAGKTRTHSKSVK
jgi:hypothetical protein